jgi:predicted XRE-type DNA-binding protein
MKKQTFKSVWDAIEDSEEEATNMKIRSQLMSALTEELKRRMLSQAETAELLGVTQPRISDLFRGRIDLFSLDTLVNMLSKLRVQIRIETRTAAIPKKTLGQRAKRAA